MERQTQRKLNKTEEYPPQDLANWITEKHEEQKQTQWEQTAPKREAENNIEQRKTTPAR
jgi:hypothetical protein